jgi:hypothetical protein
MGLTYRIHDDLGLVHVRYDGLIDFVETATMLHRYLAEPDYQPARKQLVDLSRATGVDSRYVDLLALNARTTEAVIATAETLLAFYAPTRFAVHLARTGLNPWTDVPGVVARIASDTHGLAAFFGLPESALAAVLASPVT